MQKALSSRQGDMCYRWLLTFPTHTHYNKLILA